MPCGKGETMNFNDAEQAPFISSGQQCTNKNRCHPADHTVKIRAEKVNGEYGIYVFDDHDSNAGDAVFTGYCCLQCLLLDVWHALDNNGKNIGDKIRALKAAKETARQ
jgi:hypothetical protein